MSVLSFLLGIVVGAAIAGFVCWIFWLGDPYRRDDTIDDD
jgi:hypothetical protein